MSQETTDNKETPQDGEAKPTITIAEKQDGSETEEKPTITIAEKQGDK
jgi:hypothetical protein